MKNSDRRQISPFTVIELGFLERETFRILTQWRISVRNPLKIYVFTIKISTFFLGLFPTFFLHMERGDGKKLFLLASRRRMKSSTCSVGPGLKQNCIKILLLSLQYIMSADPANMSCSGAGFRGIINSNLLGTQFR